MKFPKCRQGKFVPDLGLLSNPESSKQFPFVIHFHSRKLLVLSGTLTYKIVTHEKFEDNKS